MFGLHRHDVPRLEPERPSLRLFNVPPPWPVRGGASSCSLSPTKLHGPARLASPQPTPDPRRSRTSTLPPFPTSPRNNPGPWNRRPPETTPRSLPGPTASIPAKRSVQRHHDRAAPPEENPGKQVQCTYGAFIDFGQYLWAGRRAERPIPDQGRAASLPKAPELDILRDLEPCSTPGRADSEVNGA